MKADQERVRMLITQTITMLCKKGLEFETELKVQGLLGVTVDNRDIFLIHLNEKYDNVSDTKDILPRQDSVATSTGNEKTPFYPQDISPDNGTACETAYQMGTDGFGMKRELQPVSPLQPNFPEFQDSMSDLFPYAECHTTESALLSGTECGDPGFMMGANPTFSTNVPPDLKDIGAGDKFTGHGGGGGGGGVILLDSGDEAEEDFKPRPQPLRQLSFGASEADSKGNIQMVPEHKMAMQPSYAPEMFRPSKTPNVQHQQNAEMELAAGSSQAWALQPVSRSQFPLNSPGGQMNPQGQRMQFNPEHIGKFTIGSNRPPAAMPAGFRGRGTSSRRPGSRQPRPTMPGRGGLVSPMKPMNPNDEMGIRHSGSPAAGGSMLGSPPLSSYSPGMSRPVRGSPAVRGSPRGRSPRTPGAAMLRGAAVGSSAMMEFASGASGSPGNQPGATQMARGALSVRTRSVDGYSYGKQTVTNYICNICHAVYKNHSSLLTHQVKVHGRQKKEGMGRPRMQPSYEEEDDNSDMDEMGEM